MIANIIIAVCIVLYFVFCVARIILKYHHAKKSGTLSGCDGCHFAGNCPHSCISDVVQDKDSSGDTL